MKIEARPRIVVITGPTAVGKSDYAVKYALKHNGEVISADSRQVYKGMDIGTGKITKKEMRGVPHYLLDVASPRTIFTVENYRKLANIAIADILSRGKLPIICGGTGFYIDAVIYNISYPHVAHDTKLQEKLQDKSVEELFTILKKYDPIFVKKLNNSEKNNTQRLIRSIEIVTTLGKMPKIKKTELYNVKWIYLKASPKVLRKRIHDRLMKRIKHGMIREVENLHTKGLSWKRMETLGLEYRYIARYLQKKMTKEETLMQLETEIWHYAKRQMVWMKRGK